MYKISFIISTVLLLIVWSNPLFINLNNNYRAAPYVASDSLPNAHKWPAGISVNHFAGSDLTPSPACLAVAPSGEVYVGIDMIGSLGKDSGKGRIVRLKDTNQDGKADAHTIFAEVNNPRGILVNGDKVFVLHTTFNNETGKANNMDLVVFEDLNQDGIADGPSRPIITNISNSEFLQKRGTDHDTNGIQMGIDGWIYIAVGDFGFHNAMDRQGTELTMLGGGIVRVRPDGTEMEVYTHGLRNIYDVAIDPYMNIFTRGNTNDGGGWNIRFSHQIQSGEYGYPVLFKNYTDEIIPALADLGGGSGTGALFMDDDRWPARYNQVPMMADWGRNLLYIHRVTPDGPSYTQQEEEFIQLSQITDLEVDGSGIMYLSAWDGPGYSGSTDKGFVVRAVPEGWKHTVFPNLKKESVKNLALLLNAGNAVTRLAVQQELLTRPTKESASEVWKIASDKNRKLYARVAAMYTYAQITEASGISNLTKLTADNHMREYAIRALTDRKSIARKVPLETLLPSLNDPSDRVKTAAIIALGRTGNPNVAEALLKIKAPANLAPPAKGTEGLHANPHAQIIPAHVAVQALVHLKATDACVKALGGENTTLALWALRHMHNEKAIQGLISAYRGSNDKAFQKEIITTLSRLYKKEAAYDASWWWGTRPDTHGPYYKGITWDLSPAIRNFLLEVAEKSGNEADFFAYLNTRHRMEIEELGGDEELLANEEVNVDLEKIKNIQGQVGESSIEDVMLAIQTLKGNSETGKKLFVTQGCVACHSISKGEIMKGPFMGQIGSIMTREQITESILKPDASISQGFSSVLISAKKDKTYMGFITEETASRVILRDIAGQVYNIRTSDIIKREELAHSMMPAGLTNALSYEELASLVAYLSEQKK